MSVSSDPCVYPPFDLQARKNELAVEDMDGGTFTISNGGVFGSMFGTPIINPPQSAILGMHGIFDRPVAIGGKVSVWAWLFFPSVSASTLEPPMFLTSLLTVALNMYGQLSEAPALTHAQQMFRTC